MRKNNFLLKHFLLFIISLFAIFLISITLFIALNLHIVRQADSDVKPDEIYSEIMEYNEISENSQKTMSDKDIWAIIINTEGDVINSYRKPDEIPTHFELTDIVRFTRWYLKDYPVFTYIYNTEILVIGYPKDSYAKLFSNYFKPDFTFSIIKNALLIFIIDIVLLFLLYSYSERRILREVKPIRNAIRQLSKGETIQKKPCPNLSDILGELVLASNIIEQKNASKNKWIRGITHDIRTPLTVIMAYTEEMDENSTDEVLHSKLSIIKSKTILINKILENLNTMYLLEDGSNIKNQKTDLSSLIKNIVIDYINTYNIEISVQLAENTQLIFGKEVLIERLIRNIIDNSIRHNDSKISINIVLEDNNTVIISDTGTISEMEVERLNNISDFYNTEEHGYGILIVKKIASIYNADIKFIYDEGLKTVICFSGYPDPSSETDGLG